MVALDVIPPPAAPGHAADREVIFRSLRFKSGLEVKNRLFRSSISGQFDDYSGHGTNARLNWEEQFARGGIGAIISSFVPVSIRGRILVRYATISGDSFPEWRNVLAAENLPVGLLDVPELPGIIEEERVVADSDTLGFLRRMKAIGGLTPREGYTALPPGRLRRAIRAADKLHGGRITWHIVYGRLAASQSSPSISPA